MRLLSTSMLSLVMLALPFAAFAQSDYIAIEQRLSAEQLRATGLSRLSADELALLNRLLRDEHASLEVQRDDRVGLRDRTPAEPVRSQVQGEFRGWSTGKILNLANGQTWRVTEGSLHLRKPRMDPAVTIAPGFMGAWYLQVEGESPRAKVSRVD